MDHDSRERKPGQPRLQPPKKLLLIGILTAAGLLIATTMLIIGVSYYLESIAHMEPRDQLKRTGLALLIIALSSLITFLLDRLRLLENSKRDNLDEEHEAEDQDRKN